MLKEEMYSMKTSTLSRISSDFHHRDTLKKSVKFSDTLFMPQEAILSAALKEKTVATVWLTDDLT